MEVILGFILVLLIGRVALWVLGKGLKLAFFLMLGLIAIVFAGFVLGFLQHGLR